MNSDTIVILHLITDYCIQTKAYDEQDLDQREAQIWL